MKRAGIGIAVFLVALGLSGVARSDVGGTLLPGGAFDLGVFYRELDRSVERDGQEETYTEGWWIGMIRIGVTGALTASVELSSGLGSGSNDDINYTVGAGLQTSMWTSGNMPATTAPTPMKKLCIEKPMPRCSSGSLSAT